MEIQVGNGAKTANLNSNSFRLLRSVSIKMTYFRRRRLVLHVILICAARFCFNIRVV